MCQNRHAKKSQKSKNRLKSAPAQDDLFWPKNTPKTHFFTTLQTWKTVKIAKNAIYTLTPKTPLFRVFLGVISSLSSPFHKWPPSVFFHAFWPLFWEGQLILLRSRQSAAPGDFQKHIHFLTNFDGIAWKSGFLGVFWKHQISTFAYDPYYSQCYNFRTPVSKSVQNVPTSGPDSGKKKTKNRNQAQAKNRKKVKITVFAHFGTFVHKVCKHVISRFPHCDLTSLRSVQIWPLRTCQIGPNLPWQIGPNLTDPDVKIWPPQDLTLTSGSDQIRPKRPEIPEITLN